MNPEVHILSDNPNHLQCLSEVPIINTFKNRRRPTHASLTDVTVLLCRPSLIDNSELPYTPSSKDPSGSMLRSSEQSLGKGAHSAKGNVIGCRGISWTTTAGRGWQHYSCPSEPGFHSAVNTVHSWDSSEDFPSKYNKRNGDSKQKHTAISHDIKTTISLIILLQIDICLEHPLSRHSCGYHLTQTICPK